MPNNEPSYKANYWALTIGLMLASIGISLGLNLPWEYSVGAGAVISVIVPIILKAGGQEPPPKPGQQQPAPSKPKPLPKLPRPKTW